MANRIESRLAELGITLPAPFAPVANYVPFVITGNQLYISGQLPLADGGLACKGHVGSDVSVDDAHAAARICAINIISQAKSALGDLDRVTRIVKLGGFVSSAPGFTDQPKVVNGTSDLMVEVFGDAGRHARSAVGVAALPLGAAVEVDAVIEFA